MESKQPRRKHTAEFRQSAVELVTKQGYRISKAARALDVNESLLRGWLDRLAPDWRTGRTELVGVESDDPQVLRERLRQLEKANAELRLERDILKKAAAYFARESQ